MQFKRTALLALSAFSLAACGDDDEPTGNGGLNDTQRIARFGELVAAGSDAAEAGAPNAAEPFTIAGLATLFGAATASLNATSNGLAFATQGSTNFATAGAYDVVAVQLNFIDDYGEGSEERQYEAIIARRGTSELIWAIADGGTWGTFDSEQIRGGVFSAPNMQWLASAGDATLSAPTLGGECSYGDQIAGMIEEQMAETYSQGGTLESWECRLATFTGEIDITGSSANQHAAGSRTARVQGTIPGVSITATFDQTNPSR